MLKSTYSRPNIHYNGPEVVELKIVMNFLSRKNLKLSLKFHKSYQLLATLQKLMRTAIRS
jgi:hypothetical protein